MKKTNLHAQKEMTVQYAFSQMYIHVAIGAKV